MKKVLTLVVVHKENRVLLGMKKRGFGEGRWNGFGGKVHDGETIEEAAAREVHEESGITVTDLCKKGILEFSFEDSEDVLEVHIFSTTTFSGTPKETEEMLPKWYSIDSIPYEEMWKDDKFWLPDLLQGRCFTGSFHFGGPNDDILEQKITTVSCSSFS